MSHEDEVGGLDEEAAKLFSALSDWAKEQGNDLGDGVAGLAGAASRAAHEVNEHVATGAPECEYCPVCRTVHVIRGASPEVRTHLATAASSLLQAAAGLLSTLAPEPTERRGPGVEHIGLDDQTDWDDIEPDRGDDA